MPLSADDFTRLASTAADALASKGTPLVESIDRLAADNSMTLEQIKRLCEAANNAAFKALFDKSNPTDREANFPVAKAEDVIARRRGKTDMSSSEKTASAPFDALSELRPLAAMGARMSKVAEAPAEPYVDPYEQKALEKRAAQEEFNAIGAAQRMREYLESARDLAQYKFASDVSEIATYFRRLDQPSAMIDFEKNAMSIHGAAITPVLSAVRKRLPYAKFASDDEEQAIMVKKAHFHVLVSQPAFLLEKVASALGEMERATKAHALLSTPGAIEAAVRPQAPHN